MAPDSAELVATILNSAWMVRHYARGARSAIHSRERAEAIRQLGEAVRYAFNHSSEFESLLAAIVDGLRPKDDAPF